jgi:manganese efflux pump family protein
MSEINFFTILITAIGLSADCFAVALCLCISKRGLTLRQFIRFPLAFGFFQAIMLVIGWLAGRTVVELISAYDHWLAFALLTVVGGRMIWESFHDEDEKNAKRDISRWFTLLALSVATSIDSLAVGLSYAFLNVDIITAAVTTGLATFVITIFGHYIGNRVGLVAGKWAEIAGGVILILTGVKILLEHLL